MIKFIKKLNIKYKSNNLLKRKTKVHIVDGNKITIFVETLQGTNKTILQTTSNQLEDNFKNRMEEH